MTAVDEKMKQINTSQTDSKSETLDETPKKLKPCCACPG